MFFGNASESHADAILSGVYEGYAPYGRDDCHLLLEVGDDPSGDTYFLRMHMLECKPSPSIIAPSSAAQRAQPASAAGRAPAPPLRPAPARRAGPARRALEESGDAADAVEAEVWDMTAAPVVFSLSNSSRAVLAAFDAFAVRAVEEDPPRRLWLIDAPEAAAMGAP
jgi:hypothetical protein